MKYLFISRKNVHARYYSNLVKRLPLDCKAITMGTPDLRSFKCIPEALTCDLSDTIANQIKRKVAKNPLWNLCLIGAIYALFLNFKETLRLAKYLYILKREDPDFVVLWNGKKLPNATVRIAAEHLKKSIFYFENGLLPGTTTLDPKGVNYTSSLSKDPSFYLSLNFDKEEQQYTKKLVQRAPHRSRKKQEDRELPKKYIFVPFQVPHDTQIVNHSPWIDSMEKLYSEVMTSLDKLKITDLKIVFKEHPTWPKHYTSLYEKNPNGIFANSNNTQELIENALGVITINSTVGLEGLLLDKPVITVGEACYNIDGLTLNAMGVDELSKRMQQLVEGWMPNERLKQNFFSYLDKEYCIHGKRSDYSEEHIHALTMRLTMQDKFSKSLKI